MSGQYFLKKASSHSSIFAKSNPLIGRSQMVIHQILIIGSVWPEPQSSAAGIRMMQLIKLFKSVGWIITYASPAAESKYSENLEGLNIVELKIEMNNSSFDSMLKSLNPTIVIFDRFMIEEQFGWRVAENCPNALRVLNTEDLHSLRRERHNAIKNSRAFKPSDLLSSDIAMREIASILRCDVSLIISAYELELLKNIFGIAEEQLHYLPFMTEKIEKRTQSQWPHFTERQNFITIGNFLHAPNYDSVLVLKNEIWPLIRKELPEVDLHVYGAYPSAKVLQLNNQKEGFLILGRAEDARQVMGKARVCLAPLRFGAGLKGKLFEAMLCGTPSVTTSVGAEAMRGSLPWNGFIEDDLSVFAENAVQLYTNKTLWNAAQEDGTEIVNQRYNKNDYEDNLISKLLKIIANLSIHRLQNFTGAMLMHHTMASTKYMSRWIEAKNT